ncbi:hypothetical protein [Marivirga lumbricoides]|uniref:hypothetical protein n=1 Tax=Marivirga lumbricoides TaxID=1046115 RepID=UPI00166708F6
MCHLLYNSLADMATLSLLFILSGFWLFYQRSKRAELPKPGKWEVYIRQNKYWATLIGISNLAIGFIFCLMVYGVGSGIFAYLISLVMIASLVVILAPLGYMNRWSIGSILLLGLLLELTL